VGGAKSYGSEEAWFSINHSLFSGVNTCIVGIITDQDYTTRMGCILHRRSDYIITAV
jgi:hypothetical protein